jgi:transcriptional regulator
VYRPPLFACDDVALLHDLLEEESFGFVTAGGETSPVPFVLDRGAGEHGSIRFHVARPNPIAARLPGAAASLLVVGPHGYVSPQWYSTRQEVPTWNYVVATATGPCRRLDVAETLAQVRDLARRHEEGPSPWSPDELDAAFRDDLLRGIVAFSMRLDRLEGKLKCSQNRDAVDREGVFARLARSADPGDAHLLRWMRRANAASA